MRRLLPFAALILLAGCGSSTAATSPTINDQMNTPAMPDCSTVWVVGKTVPANYQGCTTNGALLPATSMACTKVRGQINYLDLGGYYYWSDVKTGKILRYKDGTDDPAYKAAYDAC